MEHFSLRLDLLLGLKVVVSKVGDDATNDNDGVEERAGGGLISAASRVGGAGSLGLGGRVTLL